MTPAEHSVSIIIPTSGRPDSLSGCLKSILRQERPSQGLEVIVVENGRRSRCFRLASSFIPRLPVRYFYQRRESAAAARNRGARLAKGDVLVFIDDDCFAEPGWLSALVAPFKDPQIVAVGGRCLPADTGILSRYLQSRGVLSKPPEEDGKVAYLLTGNMAIRKETFFSIGGFDEAFLSAGGEDDDFGYRLRAKAVELIYVPEATVVHAHPSTLFNFLATFHRYGRGHANIMRRASKRDRLIGLIYLAIDWAEALPVPLNAFLRRQEGALNWRERLIFSSLDLLRKSAAFLGIIREMRLLLRP